MCMSPTDQEISATERIVCFSSPEERGHMGSTRIHQGAEGGGTVGFFLVSLEGTGEADYARSLRVGCLSDFGGLWALVLCLMVWSLPSGD